MLPGETRESVSGPDWPFGSPYEGMSLSSISKLFDLVIIIICVDHSPRLEGLVKNAARKAYALLADSRAWNDENATRDTWDLAYPQAFASSFKAIIEGQLRMLDREGNLDSNLVSYALPFIIRFFEFYQGNGYKNLLDSVSLSVFASENFKFDPVDYTRLIPTS